MAKSPVVFTPTFPTVNLKAKLTKKVIESYGFCNQFNDGYWHRSRPNKMGKYLFYDLKLKQWAYGQSAISCQDVPKPENVQSLLFLMVALGIEFPEQKEG